MFQTTTIYVGMFGMKKWHEEDGKGTANEFTTRIIDCIKKNMRYKK